MRSEQEAARAIELYADTVRRICMLHLKSDSDTEDIFQTVFLKYVLYSGAFESEEHEKAWLIRVTLNACKDFMKSFFRSHTVPLDEIEEVIADVPEDHSDVLEAVLSLPPKYKTVIYLYFYEPLALHFLLFPQNHCIILWFFIKIRTHSFRDKTKFLVEFARRCILTAHFQRKRRDTIALPAKL